MSNEIDMPDETTRDLGKLSENTLRQVRERTEVQLRP